MNNQPISSINNISFNTNSNNKIEENGSNLQISTPNQLNLNLGDYMTFKNGIAIQDLSNNMINSSPLGLFINPLNLSISTSIGNIVVDSASYIYMTNGTSQPITIESGGNFIVNTNATTGIINMTAGDNVNITAGENFTLNTNATTGIISLNAGTTTGSITLDSSQTDINGGLVNITANSTSVNMSGQSIDINSSTGSIQLTSNNDKIGLDASTDITLLSTGDINLTSTTGKTYINYSNPNVGDGELVCSTYSSGGDISIQSTTGMSLNVSNGALNLTSTGAGITISTTDQQIDMIAGNDINMYNNLYFKNNASPLWNTYFNTGGFKFDIADLGNLVILDAEAGANLYLQNPSGNNQIQPSSITIVSSIGGTASITLNGPAGYAILGLTDGVNSNDITALGYTTKNSVQNATHYLNFSDSSSTGVGPIQKTAGISCNPFHNTLSSNFVYTNLAIPTTITGATFSSGTLTLTNPAPFTALGQSITNSNNYFNITMSANITALTPVNFRINGMYLVYITGNATIPYTISSSLGSGIKTNYTIITVPATGKALMRINYDGTTYYVNCSLFT